MTEVLYQIVQEDDIAALERAVTVAMLDGFMPLGPPFREGILLEGTFWMQAIWKPALQVGYNI